MPAWVRENVDDDRQARARLDELSPLVLVSQVNRAYALAEPLRKTAARPWWDILTWQLALVAERDMVNTRG